MATASDHLAAVFAHPVSDILGTPDDDRISGKVGMVDHLKGLAGDDTLIARGEGDWLSGGNGNDALNDNDDPNRIFGGSGADTAKAGDGDDRANGDDGADLLLGEAGRDTLFGDRGNDHLEGGTEGDVLYGGNGNDTLLGEAGRYNLRGDVGHDRLNGGSGFDTLRGGSGNDTLTGGIGADAFVFRKGDGVDRITDFHSGVDQVQVLVAKPDSLSIAFTYQNGNATVKFLDVTLIIEDVAPNSLDFGAGGDFALIQI